MRQLVATIAVLLCTSAAAACRVHEYDLVGGWAAAKPWAFYEQMTFQIEGESRWFDSWRHKRPDVSRAQWELHNCVLVVRHESGLVQTYEVSLGKRQLVLTTRTKAGLRSSFYRRIVERRRQ